MENPITRDNALNGLILAGGNSRRMGKDKALIEYHGRSQLEHLTHLLSPYCAEVVVSAKRKEHYNNFKVIVDKFDFESPLNGILSAFEYRPNNAWLVVACDMPMIDAKSIHYLLRHRSSDCLATSYKNNLDDPEPLFTIYEQTAFPSLISYYKQGNYSPQLFLKQNKVNLLLPTHATILQNINTQQDFDKIKDNETNKEK